MGRTGTSIATGIGLVECVVTSQGDEGTLLLGISGHKILRGQNFPSLLQGLRWLSQRHPIWDGNICFKWKNECF